MIGTLKRVIGHDLAAAVAADAEAHGLRGEIPDAAPVTETELAGLPEPARRYIHTMGVAGRPRDGAFGRSSRGASACAPRSRSCRSKHASTTHRFPRRPAVPHAHRLRGIRSDDRAATRCVDGQRHDPREAAFRHRSGRRRPG